MSGQERQQEDLPPGDAFALLGNEVRMSILQTLWEARDPFAPPSENALSFTELRNRVGLDDPGRLNYHLNQLVGMFIDRSNDGYVLKPAATGVMRAVSIGDISSGGDVEQFSGAEPCPFCTGRVEVLYEQPTLTVRCTECDGEYRTRVGPNGTLMSSLRFPPMGVEGRDGQELWEALGTYIAVRAFGYLKGVCPECMVQPTMTMEVCSSHAETGLCEECGSTQAVLATMRCENCKSVYRFPAWVTIMIHPEVMAFFHERGVDATGGLTLDVYNRLLTAREVIHSEDPLELEVIVKVAGDELRTTVDEALTVTDVRIQDSTVDQTTR